MFKNKTLLITGGTGSFGNAVLKKFINTDHFSEIRIFSRDEKKQDDMRNLYKNEKIKFYIGDVRDYSSIERAMRGVDYVFHAAALKQVPSCEFFPVEATKTNVFGTQNTIDAAAANNVKKIICLSTDKAAYPINAMGISKALMEKVAIAASRNYKNTTVCLTRYGNVMASRGSVIPLFLNQIENDNELTITDPNMTRFLMSLDDAVELVLFAFENGNPGDLFVNKAPAGTVRDLAVLRSNMLSKVNSHVKALLSEIDWYWSRAAKGNDAVPSAIATYATTIYSEKDTKETEIGNLNTIAKIKEYEARAYTETRKDEVFNDDGTFKEYHASNTTDFARTINMTTHFTVHPNKTDAGQVSLTAD